MWVWLKLTILPPLGYALIRVLGWTLRLRTLHAERVRAFWESGRGVIIAAGAGHLVNLERPDEFNAILREFLERV